MPDERIMRRLLGMHSLTYEGADMKPLHKEDDSGQLVEKTVEFLTSPDGKQALRNASDESKKAAEPFRQARNVPQERLNRRFNI